jgi:hypothetical protein
MFKDHQKLEAAFDKEVVTKLKLTEITKKNLCEISALKKALIKTQTAEPDTRRTLKKEIRALKNMVGSMKMSEDNSDTDEDLSDEDLSDEDSEEQDEATNTPEAKEPQDCEATWSQTNVLYQYQKIKHYMVKNNRSLGSIVRDQSDKHFSH